MRRLIEILLMAVTTVSAQSGGGEQRPANLPGWPCTGKERAFDPVYLRTAEATGGHMLLLDKSETDAFTVMALTGAKHKTTILRGAGRMDNYRDVEFPVDSAIESLFLTFTIQCMQTILLYDASGVGVRPEAIQGEDHWYRAARIAVIPKPTRGMWRVRLAGNGAYSFAIEAQTRDTMSLSKLSSSKLDASGQNVEVFVSPKLGAADFQLLSPAGEITQPVALAAKTEGRYEGSFQPASRQFRLMAQGVDGSGLRWMRTDARLFGGD